MCCKRLSGFIINHLVTVAMVGADKHLPIHRKQCIHHSAYTGIHRFHRLNCGRKHACMPYHIRVCVVYNNQIIFSGANCLYQTIGYGNCAHFRLQIIGCNLGRGHQPTILIGIGFLHTAVEEKRNVCIFFCFRCSQLL